MKQIDDEIVFPLSLTWEDGSIQILSDLGDIQCNLEDFDSSKEPGSSIRDANGHAVRLKVSMTWIEVLEKVVPPPCTV